MAHFTIKLSENQQADVYFGKVFKKSVSLNPFKRWLVRSEPVTGYKIMLKNSSNSYTVYRTKEGKWSSDPDGMSSISEPILLGIKEAILKKEESEAAG